MGAGDVYYNDQAQFEYDEIILLCWWFLKSSSMTELLKPYILNMYA